MSEIDGILERASGAGRPLSAELLPLVYDELRSLASRRLRDDPAGETLQPTALVHEAWLRLGGDEDRDWSDRAHFFRAAALAMRRILVDRARAKASAKRDPSRPLLDVHELEIADAGIDDRVLRVDELLDRLEREDPTSSRVILLKFFGGLTNREIASMDGVTERTVERRWSYARVSMLRMMRSEGE